MCFVTAMCSQLLGMHACKHTRTMHVGRMHYICTTAWVFATAPQTNLSHNSHQCPVTAVDPTKCCERIRLDEATFPVDLFLSFAALFGTLCDKDHPKVTHHEVSMGPLIGCSVHHDKIVPSQWSLCTARVLELQVHRSEPPCDNIIIKYHALLMTHLQ